MSGSLVDLLSSQSLIVRFPFKFYKRYNPHFLDLTVYFKPIFSTIFLYESQKLTQRDKTMKKNLLIETTVNISRAACS